MAWWVKWGAIAAGSIAAGALTGLVITWAATTTADKVEVQW